MAGDHDRGIRVFISSTFKDMLAERDALVSRTFPALRATLRERGIELCEIDLRWGITEEQSERGDTLPILFSEIDRCRPYFVAILGDRYGWIPPDDAFTRDLVRTYPWLKTLRGRSVTEMEIRYGALSATHINADAIFFERASSGSVEENEETQARDKLAQLKEDLRNRNANLHRYDTPDELGRAVQAALLDLVDKRFPSTSQQDNIERAERLHAAFAVERRRLYIGGSKYLTDVRNWLERPRAPLLVFGTSGGGKSALLANFADTYRSNYPTDLVFEHYLGAAPDAGDPVSMLRRLWSAFERALPAIPAIPAASAGVVAQLPEMIAAASAAMEQLGQRALIVIDGLDKLTGGHDLNWWPQFLPPNVRLLASTLPGDAYDAARARRWETLAVLPLTRAQRLEILQAILQKFGKTLTDNLTASVVEHAQSGIPLYLRTVLEELRRFGSHEELDDRVRYFLAAPDLGNLFDRVLERLEKDHGLPAVESAARMMWAARAGLEEAELIAAMRIPPLEWSALRAGFGDTLRDQDGRLFFDHDYLRSAVFARYLGNDERVRESHAILADHFDRQPASLRRSEELPFQLGRAEAFPRLLALLTDMSEFTQLRARGDVELLGHWLKLSERGIAPGPALTEALRRHSGDGPWTAHIFTLAHEISEFLGFAGVRGHEVVELARQRLDQALAVGNEANTIWAKAALANALFDGRNYDEACHLQEATATDASRLHGPLSREALTQRAQFARMLRVKAQRESALRYRAALRAGTGLPETEFGRTLTAEEEEVRAEDILRQQLFVPNFIHVEPSSELLEALDIEAHVLDDALEAFGENDDLALESATALAEIQRLAGDSDAAKTLQEEVVERRLRLNGAKHPDTIRAVEAYVEILCALRFLDNARVAEESVLERRRATLGESHPLTLRSKKLLADILSFVDDDASSLALKREIQTGRRANSAEMTHATSLTGVQTREILKGMLLLGLAILIAWGTYHGDAIMTEGARLIEQIRLLLDPS